MSLISLIAAIEKDTRVIGDSKTNDLVWKRMPGDMKRFKELTLHHPVIMGRKTFESLGGKALPGRTNIVISKNVGLVLPDGVMLTSSLEEAIKIAEQMDDEIYVIGGGEIYAQAIEKANQLYLTEVDGISGGDILFPKFDNFTKVTVEEMPPTEQFPRPYRFITLVK